MKKQIIYNKAYERMHCILSAYGLCGEKRNFGTQQSYDIRMHDMLIGSLFKSDTTMPMISLSGGVIIPLFHHDRRKANMRNAIQRFDAICSMIVNDYPYNHIEYWTRDNIRIKGR